MKENNELIDQCVVQHAIFKILDSEIISCFCGAYRRIVQKDTNTLVTQCTKCNAEEPFNIGDLALIGGALLNYAVSENYEPKIKAPNVTFEQICQMIEELEGLNDWPEEYERQAIRSKLRVLKGGLSSD